MKRLLKWLVLEYRVKHLTYFSSGLAMLNLLKVIVDDVNHNKWIKKLRVPHYNRQPTSGTDRLIALRTEDKITYLILISRNKYN